MKLNPARHDYVVQPDGRIFHVKEAFCTVGAPTYVIDYQERRQFKNGGSIVRTFLRWPAGSHRYDREAAQRLADRLEELVRAAGRGT